MENHVRNVGKLFFYSGIGFGVLSIGVFVAAGGMDGLLLTDDPFYKRNDLASIPLERLLAAAYLIFALAMAIPMMVVGRAILAWQGWAKTVGTLISALLLLLFPVGTAVGVYGLWVLTDEATEFLFENAHARRR